MRVGLAILLLVSIAAASRAQPSSNGTATRRARAHLLYVREAGMERCPEEAEVRAQVAARLGYDPFADQAPITVSVALSRAGRRLTARIELLDRSGEVMGARELSSIRPDCVALGQAVALAVSLAVDPLGFGTLEGFRASREGAPQQSPGSPTRPRLAASVTSSSPPPPPPPTPAPKPRPSERQFRFRLGAGALAALGAAPAVAFGFTVRGALRGPHWSVGLEGRFDVPAGEPVAGGFVTTGLYLATVVPCFHVRAFAGCALAALGAQRAEGADYAISRDAVTFFAAAGARAALEVPLAPRVELDFDADLLAAITRATYVVDTVTVFRQPPVSGAFHLAMQGYFR